MLLQHSVSLTRVFTVNRQKSCVLEYQPSFPIYVMSFPFHGVLQRGVATVGPVVPPFQTSKYKGRK